jgi:hypothetical protein
MAEESSDELVQKLLRGEVQVSLIVVSSASSTLACSLSRKFACDAMQLG